ncbi:MAG: DUF1329 domain-containing protein [bacterium]
MIKRLMLLGAGLSILLWTAIPLEAKVTPEEAAKLNGELTPAGAIRAGNQDGTIPEWTGGVTKCEEGRKEGDAYKQPFPPDKVLYTITPQNMDQYADKLTEGYKAMFKRYPDTWKMNVYPTHRTAAWPQRIYDATIRNATTAELSEGGNGVLNATEGAPFPIPKEGIEAIWNHLLRYRGESIYRMYGQIAVTSSGAFTPVVMEEKIMLPYAQPGATIESVNNVSVYFLQEVMAPARLAGEILLVIDTIDQVRQPRSAWTYNPGQRRVRRAPNIAYDNPGTASDGLRTSDQLDMFNGAPDRYNWKLVGRKEMLVGYNDYELQNPNLKYKDILHAGHTNPEVLHYELHRVWVVDATVKEGTSHIYARRTFYFDEDSWQALAIDIYDARGQIWRVHEAHPIVYCDVPFLGPVGEFSYDLQNGRYLAVGLTNETQSWKFNVRYNLEDFTPDSMRRAGKR